MSLPSFSITAPEVSEESLRTEQAQVPEEDQQFYRNEKYGWQALPRETPEMRKNALDAMNEAFSSIEDKENYELAMRNCPDVLEREAPRLGFLRAEGYDGVAAARRMVKYWDHRLTAFGEERAFLPMFSADAKAELALTKDDMARLRTGVIQILPPDRIGRPVLYFRLEEVNRENVDRLQIVRIELYLFTLVAMSESAQRHGYVVLADTSRYSIDIFNRKVTKLMIDIYCRACPMPLRALNVCFPAERCVAKLIFPVALFFLGPSVRLRTTIHTGVPRELLFDLSELGMKKECLPSNLGGTFRLDQFYRLYKDAIGGSDDEQRKL